jgi:hypothetical protein
VQALNLAWYRAGTSFARGGSTTVAKYPVKFVLKLAKKCPLNRVAPFSHHSEVWWSSSNYLILQNSFFVYGFLNKSPSPGTDIA